MTRRLAGGIALAALLAACVDAGPSPSASPSAPAPTSAPPSPVVEGLELPDPGQPFDAEAILAAMRESRRPGGVPDELETDAIAATLGEAIWTLDGDPWTTTSAGGSCGPQTCTLEIAGTTTGAPSEDLWVFEVAPSTGQVQLVSAELGAVPPELAESLDVVTRSLLDAANFEGLNLTNVRWLPPPDGTQFVLSYRSGDEERSGCGTDITLDAAEPGIVSDLSLDC